MVLLMVVVVVALPWLLGSSMARSYIAASLSDHFKRKVTIKQITASWSGGVVLKGLSVQTGNGFRKQAAWFCYVNQIQLPLSPLALLRKHITSLKISLPDINLIVNQQGKLNVTSLPPLDMVVDTVTVVGGQLHIINYCKENANTLTTASNDITPDSGTDINPVSRLSATVPALISTTQGTGVYNKSINKPICIAIKKCLLNTNIKNNTISWSLLAGQADIASSKIECIGSATIAVNHTDTGYINTYANTDTTAATDQQSLQKACVKIKLQNIALGYLHLGRILPTFKVKLLPNVQTKHANQLLHLQQAAGGGNTFEAANIRGWLALDATISFSATKPIKVKGGLCVSDMGFSVYDPARNYLFNLPKGCDNLNSNFELSYDPATGIANIISSKIISPVISAQLQARYDLRVGNPNALSFNITKGTCHLGTLITLLRTIEGAGKPLNGSARGLVTFSASANDNEKVTHFALMLGGNNVEINSPSFRMQNKEPLSINIAGTLNKDTGKTSLQISKIQIPGIKANGKLTFTNIYQYQQLYHRLVNNNSKTTPITTSSLWKILSLIKSDVDIPDVKLVVQISQFERIMRTIPALQSLLKDVSLTGRARAELGINRSAKRKPAININITLPAQGSALICRVGNNVIFRKHEGKSMSVALKVGIGCGDNIIGDAQPFTLTATNGDALITFSPAIYNISPTTQNATQVISKTTTQTANHKKNNDLKTINISGSWQATNIDSWLTDCPPMRNYLLKENITLTGNCNGQTLMQIPLSIAAVSIKGLIDATNLKLQIPLSSNWYQMPTNNHTQSQCNNTNLPGCHIQTQKATTQPLLVNKTPGMVMQYDYALSWQAQRKQLNCLSNLQLKHTIVKNITRLTLLPDQPIQGMLNFDIIVDKIKSLGTYIPLLNGINGVNSNNTNNAADTVKAHTFTLPIKNINGQVQLRGNVQVAGNNISCDLSLNSNKASFVFDPSDTAKDNICTAGFTKQLIQKQPTQLYIQLGYTAIDLSAAGYLPSTNTNTTVNTSNFKAYKMSPRRYHTLSLYQRIPHWLNRFKLSLSSQLQLNDSFNNYLHQLVAKQEISSNNNNSNRNSDFKSSFNLAGKSLFTLKVNWNRKQPLINSDAIIDLSPTKIHAALNQSTNIALQPLADVSPSKQSGQPTSIIFDKPAGDVLKLLCAVRGVPKQNSLQLNRLQIVLPETIINCPATVTNHHNIASHSTSYIAKGAVNIDSSEIHKISKWLSPPIFHNIAGSLHLAIPFTIRLTPTLKLSLTPNTTATINAQLSTIKNREAIKLVIKELSFSGTHINAPVLQLFTNDSLLSLTAQLNTPSEKSAVPNHIYILANNIDFDKLQQAGKQLGNQLTKLASLHHLLRHWSSSQQSSSHILQTSPSVLRPLSPRASVLSSGYYNPDKLLAILRNFDIAGSVNMNDISYTDPTSGAHLTLQKIRGTYQLDHGKVNMSYLASMNGGVVAGQATADINKPKPIIVYHQTSENLQITDALEMIVESEFPGLEVNGDINDKVTINIPVRPLITGQIKTDATGITVCRNGILYGPGAPGWLIKLFPGLKLVQYNWSKMVNRYHKLPGGIKKNHMLFDGQAYNIYIIGVSKPVTDPASRNRVVARLRKEILTLKKQLNPLIESPIAIKKLTPAQLNKYNWQKYQLDGMEKLWQKHLAGKQLHISRANYSIGVLLSSQTKSLFDKPSEYLRIPAFYSTSYIVDRFMVGYHTTSFPQKP